jgi:hypothetical protein
MPIIPAFGRQRQEEDHKPNLFQANLEPVSKTKKVAKHGDTCL